MDGTLHRFIRFLRLHGLRISVAEALDAVAAVSRPGIVTDREVLRSALAVSLVKDRRDLEIFDDVFDRFFRLQAVVTTPEEHGHAHDDLSDEGDLQEFTLSDELSDTPQDGHSHDAPKDIKDYFKPEDLAQQYNLHQEANKLDMASMTDEIIVSKDGKVSAGEAARVQISTNRLHNPGTPGRLTKSPGLQIDAELSVAEEMALLNWLGEPDEDGDEPDVDPDLAALRERLAPLLAALPEQLRQHLEGLLSEQQEVEEREIRASRADVIEESERIAFEDALRRLLHSLRGAPRPRRHVSGTGVIDSRRTMRTNMRYDGVPFRPVLVSRREDRPRLVILCDVSLSVRATSAFALHLVHSLQSIASQVRSFAFVDECAEITSLFADHHVQQALSRIMAGKSDGGKIEVDADSDYGSSLRGFLDEYGSSLNHRTTVIVVGDGRGNGKDPAIETFAEIARRARSVVWLTPEPRYSWQLGRCDLPLYAEHCDKVEVVRNLRQLREFSHTMAEGAQ
ncbi:VWA domain-containing protein [Flexivirga alba]|uniref:VWA domain-containing protein n=1 Tax=Flexivirga alba TaxID=702742 RepID=A0ABW2AAR5_9MICO